ncbi:MAG: polysaccharide deacetylase family protein [Clostridia bacterium]|nr:polysaccharide deacetylase family protein [Clostridia bacterium]
MKAILSSIMTIALMLLFTFSGFAKENAVSWYCVRKKDNTQPTLSKELQFTEKYDLYWCDRKHKGYGDEEKVIYLTFDAGYENGNIERILNVLKKEEVKATFFILDNMILKNESLVKRMIDEGHLVANHTMKHKDMTKMSSINEFNEELTALEKLYENSYGVKMEKYYRPPEGKISEENLKWAKELGYKTVMWSFAYADWDNGKQPSRESALAKILENIHNGEVMLLHPTSSTNADIMEELIKTLKSQGFRFATVEELCK